SSCSRRTAGRPTKPRLSARSRDGRRPSRRREESAAPEIRPRADDFRAWLKEDVATRARFRNSWLTVWLVPAAAEVLVDLPALPSGTEEAGDPEQHDSGDGYGEARTQHRPVEPEGAAVIEHVDCEPHH